MSQNTEITKASSNAVAARTKEVENIAAAAKQDAGFDAILKFKKGVYAVDEKTVPLGTEYLAHATAWVKSWTKFIDGEF
jgi:hypothetical protein